MIDDGEALNLLLKNARDSAESFRQGASMARNPTFQALFRDRTDERENLIRTLEAEVASSGATPAREGTMFGEINGVVTYARDTLARGSDRGLIEELVRRERLVTRHFEDIATGQAAPERARRIAADTLKTLSAQHHELEALADQFD